jgi:hypothetical protein
MAGIRVATLSGRAMRGSSGMVEQPQRTHADGAAIVVVVNDSLGISDNLTVSLLEERANHDRA